jgi:5-methylcytosine-specific restriction enzyme A
MPYLPKKITDGRAKERQNYRNRLADDNRPNSSQRGYDGVWKKVRLEQLKLYPWCADCLGDKKYTFASEVHHCIKLKERPELRDVSGNLMSLCKPCHQKRTAAGQ